jgi:hypothetical protein
MSVSPAPRAFDDVAEMTAIERYSSGERVGLFVGDLILAVGGFAPSDVVADPEIWSRLGRHDWIVVVRKGLVFRLCPGNGLDGLTLEPRLPLDTVAVPEDGRWVDFHVGLQPGRGLLLLPDAISPLWSMLPVAMYAHFRLWQMMVATLLLYGVAFVMDPLVFAIVYGLSVVVAALGGPALLRDAARSHGFQSRGRIGLVKGSDAAALELATAALYRQRRAERDAADRSATSGMPAR